MSHQTLPSLLCRVLRQLLVRSSDAIQKKMCFLRKKKTFFFASLVRRHRHSYPETIILDLSELLAFLETDT